MKKILVLFVLAFGLMSFSSSAFINERSVDSFDDIEQYICTIHVYGDDGTFVGTFQGSSYVSMQMACHYAKQKFFSLR